MIWKIKYFWRETKQQYDGKMWNIKGNDKKGAAEDQHVTKYLRKWAYNDPETYAKEHTLRTWMISQRQKTRNIFINWNE